MIPLTLAAEADPGADQPGPRCGSSPPQGAMGAYGGRRFDSCRAHPVGRRSPTNRVDEVATGVKP
jgi:hypothetical protein